MARVTIAIPTFNRAELLKISLRSALAQEYEDLEVLVVDNASTDDTDCVVKSVSDRRLRYVRNESNLGLFRNWNRAIGLSTSPYFCLLQDDDVLLPAFVGESVRVMEACPSAGLSVAEERLIDIDGLPFSGASRDVSDSKRLAAIARLQKHERPPMGIVTGQDYLNGVVSGRNWVIHLSAALFRMEALKEIAGFDHPHGRDTLDVNLYCRMAARWDIAVVRQLLCEVRLHAASQTQSHFDAARSSFSLALTSERIDAIGRLMQSPEAAEPAYRRWLGKQLLRLNFERSQETQEHIPALNYDWDEKVTTVRRELCELVPSGEDFILIDSNKWGAKVAEGRNALPLLERDGNYWGAPPDDETAIREVERHRLGGVKFIVFGWPAFWWLDHYSRFSNYLDSRYGRVVDNSRLKAYRLDESFRE